METFAYRIDTESETRQRFEPEEVLLQDHGRWPGARLELWNSTGPELPETVLTQHGIVLSLNPTHDVEVKFAGARMVRGSAEPATVSIHPAGLPYGARRLRASHERRQLIVLGLEPQFVRSVMGTRRYELIPSFGRRDVFVETVLKALVKDVREGYPADAVYGQSLLVALAAHLARHSGRTVEGRRDGLRDFIHDHLYQSLSLTQLAAQAQCDVRSFTRWFKAEFGMPAHRYVMAARVERARSLLLDSQRSLADIALLCGFNTQSHMTTVFRRFVGVTPGTFRAAPRGRALRSEPR